MTANSLQIKSVYELLEKNNSLIWDGTFGFYSNGNSLIRVSWSFDNEKTVYKIEFDINGKIITK